MTLIESSTLTNYPEGAMFLSPIWTNSGKVVHLIIVSSIIDNV